MIILKVLGMIGLCLTPAAIIALIEATTPPAFRLKWLGRAEDAEARDLRANGYRTD